MTQSSLDTHSRRQRTGRVIMFAVGIATLCVLAVFATALSTGGLSVATQSAIADPSGGLPAQLPNPVSAGVEDNTTLPSVAIATDTSQTTPSVNSNLDSNNNGLIGSNKAPPAATAVAPDATYRQLRTFRQLWNIVNDRYIYPNFNGLDWNSIKPDTEARIKAGITDEQFYILIQDLIHNLNDNHSSFLSPKQAEEEDKEYQGTQQYVGIGVVLEANRDQKYLYILQVYENSPASEANIYPHDHILSINGMPAINDDGVRQDKLLEGEPNTKVTLVVRTPAQEPRTITVGRRNVSSINTVENRILPAKKRIGYISIPTFFEEDMSQRVREALKTLTRNGKLDGLIVDLRVNGGGSYPVLTAHLGFFSRGLIGRLVDRNGTRSTINISPERIGNSQTVPLVILVGPSTASYAEVFAGALQAKGRAKIIGQVSAGNIETLRAHSFEDGSLIWLAEETFKLPNGGSWEGMGLQPDILIGANWDEFTPANDPVISAALETLEK